MGKKIHQSVDSDMRIYQNIKPDLDDVKSSLAESTNHFKPSWSIWEEFDQRGVNVTWFGAVADANYYDAVNKKYFKDAAKTISATNNKTAFQSAVDYLESIGGGTLYVPNGTYCFKSDTINGVKWKTKVSMVGESVSGTKFVTEGALFDLFYNTDFVNDGTMSINNFLEDVRFENFQCDLIGLSATYSTVNGKALFILGMRRARFHNLLLQNSIGTALGCDFLTETVISNVIVYNAGRNWGVANGQGTVISVGQSGIGIGTGSLDEETLMIKECHIYNCGNYGIFLERQGANKISKYAKITNCHVEGNRVGLGNKGSESTIFTGCTSINNIEDGISISQNSQGDQIIGCHVEGNGKDGIYLANNSYGDITIADNHVLNNNRYGIESTTIAGRTKSNINIVNNNTYGNAFSGIKINGSHVNINIANNRVFNNCKLSTDTVTDSGIQFNTADRINVINNYIYDDQVTKTQKNGIRVESGVTNYFIDGNSLRDNVTNQIYFENSNTTGILGTNMGYSASSNKPVINTQRTNVTASAILDATNVYRLVINAGSATTITNLTGLVDGQELIVLNTISSAMTLQNNAGGSGSMRLKGGTNVVLNQWDAITLVCVSSTWYQK